MDRAPYRGDSPPHAYELNKAEARAHILEGYLKAIDHLDEVIQCDQEPVKIAMKLGQS